MSTVGVRLKSFRRRLFSLAVVSRPGKKHPPLCSLCLCGKSSIRLPWAAIKCKIYPGLNQAIRKVNMGMEKIMVELGGTSGS